MNLLLISESINLDPLGGITSKFDLFSLRFNQDFCDAHLETDWWKQRSFTLSYIFLNYNSIQNFIIICNLHTSYFNSTNKILERFQLQLIALISSIDLSIGKQSKHLSIYLSVK